MDLFTLWVVMTLPSVGKFISLISGVLFVTCFAGGLVYHLEGSSDKDASKAKYLLHKWCPSMVFICLISTMIPSHDQMKYIVGGYVATNIEGVEKLPKNIVEFANKFLEEQTKEDK